MYSQDPLSNDQLRQLIESNARAIQGNSESIAQLRQQVNTTSESIIELRQQVSETNQIVREGFQAVQSDIQQLAQFMSQFFQGQANHNNLVDGSLEDHERRIAQVEANELGD